MRGSAHHIDCRHMLLACTEEFGGHATPGDLLQARRRQALQRGERAAVIAPMRAAVARPQPAARSSAPAPVPLASSTRGTRPPDGLRAPALRSRWTRPGAAAGAELIVRRPCSRATRPCRRLHRRRTRAMFTSCAPTTRSFSITLRAARGSAPFQPVAAAPHQFDFVHLGMFHATCACRAGAIRCLRPTRTWTTRLELSDPQNFN